MSQPYFVRAPARRAAAGPSAPSSRPIAQMRPVPAQIPPVFAPHRPDAARTGPDPALFAPHRPDATGRVRLHCEPAEDVIHRFRPAWVQLAVGRLTISAMTDFSAAKPRE